MNADNLSRRGILGLLGSAASLVRTPGEVIAKTALSSAGALSMGEAAVLSNRFHDIATPLGAAQKLLLDRSNAYTYGGAEFRPSIACFRSASTTVKAQWERTAQAEDQRSRDLAQIALNLLTQGKISP